MLFSQRDRQIFPTYRFYELLEVMTQPQKDRIFKKIVTQLNAPDEKMFQLRLMFEHEINGMDADKDEPVSLDHKLFDEDFLLEKPKRPVLQPSRTVELIKGNFPAATSNYRTESNRVTQVRNTMPVSSPCISNKKKPNSEVQHLKN